jgi:hypothetical protein
VCVCVFVWVCVCEVCMSRVYEMDWTRLAGVLFACFYTLPRMFCMQATPPFQTTIICAASMLYQWSILNI